ncbi:uncharacterized protein LOC121866557 [Homarus americanus]|uniref:uncharacterized protein LOC121866557 n=1 Tax=Homarus americanus TaxID=6706 RepID=UPI001C46F550|nr:uncharacterized protein LOC121866557 [Homarus americanus]
MVGVVRDVVIPVKGDPVFTIVCEILTTPAPEEEKPHTTRLWKMASAWRVISFFVVVFVLPTVLISLPLYARYHLYHARNVPMTETDTRALNHAVSSFWCQGQRVTSNGTLDAFKVAGLPRLQEKRRHVTLKRNLTLRHDDIEYWGVYLLEGSSFALTSSARWPGGVLLVVQGEENLRKCFYRENRLEEELNGNKPAMNNVYKSPYDVETHPVTMEEERHWEEEDVGGEVFDDDDHESISKVKVAEIQLEDGDDEDDDDLDDLLPGLSDDKIHRHHKYDIVEKVANAPMRKNGKGKKIKNGKSTKRNKKEIQHRRPSRPRTRLCSKSETTTLLKKLDILHMFNDTLEVQTGNSSFLQRGVLGTVS